MDDIKEVEEERKTQFWYKSTNKSKLDTKNEDGGYSNPKGEESRTNEETPPLKQPKKYIKIRKEKITCKSSMKKGY